MNNRPYDCIVAGGGIAGCLFATRLAQLRPQWRILLLEQANVLGGRMRSFSGPDVQGYGLNSYVHGYGLNLVSSPLFNFILELYKQTLNPQQFPEWLDHNKSIEIACLSGSELSTLEGPSSRSSSQGLYSEEAAKIFGGTAVKRQWPDFIAKIEEAAKDPERADKSLAKSCAYGKKDPLIQVLEIITALDACLDPLHCSARSISNLMSMHFASITLANNLSPLLLDLVSACSNVETKLDRRIFQADFQDELWSLKTQEEVYSSPWLVVAQPPWEAARWLNKEMMPDVLNILVSKVQPTSLVSLSCPIDSKLETPDVTFILAEKTQAIRTHPEEIVFRKAIPFEASLQAPEVVKTLKALKRSQKKFLGVYNIDEGHSGHLALLPYAWPHSYSVQDEKWQEKLTTKEFQTSRLSFIGDSYGAHLNGDENLIKSLLQALEVKFANC